MLTALIVAAAIVSAAPPAQRLGPDSSASARRVRVMVLPIIFTSPDTRWAGGILPQVNFQLPRARRTSSVRLDAFYTQEKQFTARLRPTIWLPRDRYIVDANIAWKYWPTSFWGVGSTPRDTTRERYTDNYVDASMGAARLVKEGLYVGVRYEMRYSRLRDLDPEGRLITRSTMGSAGGVTSSVGASIRWDTRNHDFYPTGGGLYQLVIKTSQPFLGSDYTFWAIDADLRRYFSPAEPHAIAVQAAARFTERGAPFQQMAGIGNVLRGYPSARYIDATLTAAQVEYRLMPIIWRVGLVGFVGVGQTAATLGDLSLNDLKYVFGLGARLQLSRSEAINIRWDFGFGLESSGDYLDLGEAF